MDRIDLILSNREEKHDLNHFLDSLIALIIYVSSITDASHELNELDDLDELNELDDLDELNELDELDEINELDQLDALVELAELDQTDKLYEGVSHYVELFNYCVII
jgi:hypothetical protein